MYALGARRGRRRDRARRRAVPGGGADRRPRRALREARRAGDAGDRAGDGSRCCARCAPRWDDACRRHRRASGLASRPRWPARCAAWRSRRTTTRCSSRCRWRWRCVAGRVGAADGWPRRRCARARGGGVAQPALRRSSRCRRSCSSSRAPRGRTSSPTARSSSTGPAALGSGAVRQRAAYAAAAVERRRSAGRCSLAAVGRAAAASRATGRGTAALLVAFPLPFLAFISQHRRGQPLSQPGAAVPGRASPAYAVAGCSLDPGLDAADSPSLVVALALACRAFGSAAGIGRFFPQTDTRTLAQRFIEAHVPPGATVLVQPYSVPLTQSRESLRRGAHAPPSATPAGPRPSSRIRLALEPYPAPAYRTIYLGDGGLDADKIYVSPARSRSDPAASRARAADPARRAVRGAETLQYRGSGGRAAPGPADGRGDAARGRRCRPTGRTLRRGPRAASRRSCTTRTRPGIRALERPGPGLESLGVEAAAPSDAGRRHDHAEKLRVRRRPGPRARRSRRRAARRCCASCATSSTVGRFITRRQPAAPIALPDGPRLRGDHALQPDVRVLLRRRSAEHRRRVARRSCRSTRCAAPSRKASSRST